MKKILAFACISFLLFSCKNNAGHKGHQHDGAQHKAHHHGEHGKSNKHMNKNSFEELAERFEDEERAEWQKPELVLKKLGDLKGKTIADIGAGTGYFTFRLAAAGAYEVTAIDVDERFENYIIDRIGKEKTTNVQTRLVGYYNPELEDNYFDALLIVNTYHHFDNKNEYMAHCLKGLKKDGELIIVDFQYEESPHGPPMDHRVKAEEVGTVLLDVGFAEVVTDQTTLEEQYIIIAKK